MTVPASPTMTSTAPDAFAPVEGERPLDDVSPVGGACDVCPHPVAEHDALGLRFCRATLAGAFSRGCICRVP